MAEPTKKQLLLEDLLRTSEAYLDDLRSGGSTGMKDRMLKPRLEEVVNLVEGMLEYEGWR
jgi:hypothetical protein